MSYLRGEAGKGRNTNDTVLVRSHCMKYAQEEELGQSRYVQQGWSPALQDRVTWNGQQHYSPAEAPGPLGDWLEPDFTWGTLGSLPRHLSGQRLQAPGEVQV